MTAFKAHQGVDITAGSVTSSKPRALTQLPSRLVLPLHSYRYDQATAIVNPGDKVHAGQPLSMASGLLSRPRISPVAGRVKSVSSRQVILPGDADGSLPSHSMVPCVEIEDIVPAEHSGHTTAWREAEPGELFEKLKCMGLDGRTGMPLDLELELLPEKSQLIINVAVYAPGSGVNAWLLDSHLADLGTAIEILTKLHQFESAVLFYTADQKNLAGRLTAQIEKLLPCRFEQIRNTYPTTHPRLLAGKALKRFPAPRKTIASQGALIVDLDRLYRLYQILVRQNPAAEFVVYHHCTGDEGQQSGKMYMALPGTPVSQLLFPENSANFADEHLFLAGGYLDGVPILDTDIPVLEGLADFFEFPEENLPVHREDACISCGICLDACPVDLSPPRLVHLINDNRFQEASAAGLEHCFDCGVCSWLCPSRIQLGHIMRKGRYLMREDRHAS
jgi:Na+-translocating ferredoxin:NAD+ oxidoreductase subunit C